MAPDPAPPPSASSGAAPSRAHSPRVLLAGIFHETHTFLDDETPLSAWLVRRGDEMLTAEGDGSPLGGVLAVARDCGWQVLPAIDMRATPSGIVTDDVVEAFLDATAARLDAEIAAGIDACYLVLHGAMVSHAFPDVEGELLQRLRQRLRERIPGREIPICGVLDLHANHSERMAANSNVLVAYRENPHVDAEATARDAARILDRILRSGELPTMVFQSTPLIWPPTGVGTADDPMKSLEAQARQLEQEHPELLAVNVLAGFAFADIPDCGVSFSAATVGDPSKAVKLLQQLSNWAIAHRDLGDKVDPPLVERLDEILAQPEGPVLIVEPSDNIGGGAPGDGAYVLKELLARDVQGALLAVNDPQAVEVARASGVGGRFDLQVGGRGSRLSGGPTRLQGEVVSLSDGRFELQDRHSHLASMYGVQIDMGPCAVVRSGGVTVLLTSRKTPPFDLGQYVSQGIDPRAARVIVVKAAVAHRRAYDPIAKASYTVDTPGPCSSNIRAFPFQHVRRPVFPLDAI